MRHDQTSISVFFVVFAECAMLQYLPSCDCIIAALQIYSGQGFWYRALHLKIAKKVTQSGTQTILMTSWNSYLRFHNSGVECIENVDIGMVSLEE